MTSFVLDAGALIAVDRGERKIMAHLRNALDRGIHLRTNPMIVAQVWRDADGRQASLARLLNSTEITSIDAQFGKTCGVLCANAKIDDPIDASIALLANPGDYVLTTDPGDISKLLAAASIDAWVVEV